MQSEPLTKQLQEVKSSVVHTDTDKSKINHALGICLLTQRTYGKQASDMEKLVAAYIRILSDYTSEQIVSAIKSWLLKSPEFPTPSDIKRVITSDMPVPVEVYIRASGILRKPENYRSWEIETAQKICSKYEKQALGFDI